MLTEFDKAMFKIAQHKDKGRKIVVLVESRDKRNLSGFDVHSTNLNLDGVVTVLESVAYKLREDFEIPKNLGMGPSH